MAQPIAEQFERTAYQYFGDTVQGTGLAQGREVILSMLGPGELFGEMGVLDVNPRSATVVTVVPSDLIVIAKSDFKRVLQENFEVSMFIMRNLVARLRTADIIDGLSNTIFVGEERYTINSSYPVTDLDLPGVARRKAVWQFGSDSIDCQMSYNEAAGSTGVTVATKWASPSTMDNTCARCCPSTSTLTVPSGNLSICKMVETQPTSNMSSMAGSSLAAVFWATSMMRRSAAMADSSALMLLGRPTNSGITM